MDRVLKLIFALIVLPCAALVAVALYETAPPKDMCVTQKRICFEGVAEYSNYVRETAFIELSNGTKLAADILIPATAEDSKSTGKFPVVFTQTPYGRAMTLVKNYQITSLDVINPTFLETVALRANALVAGGDLIADQASIYPWAETLIKQGYIVVAVDAAGTGASLGTPNKDILQHKDDANDILDWIVAQEWSDGNVGVYGHSYSALTGFAATASGHNALKAAILASVPMYTYDSIGYPKGLYAKGFADPYLRIVRSLDAVAVPTFMDEQGWSELGQTIEQRRNESFGHYVADLYESKASSDIGENQPSSWSAVSAESLVEAANQNNVPKLLITGWQDVFVEGAFDLYNQNPNNTALIVRPWHHAELLSNKNDLSIAAESLAWFDYWLKGKTTEPHLEGIQYFVHKDEISSRDVGVWRQAEVWPPENVQMKQHSTDLVGGSLSEIVLGTAQFGGGTTGENTRWNGVVGSGVYEQMDDLNSNLPQWSHRHKEDTPARVAGSIIISLKLNSPPDSAYIFAVVELAKGGKDPTYLTEGFVRIASDQKTAQITLYPTAFDIARDDEIYVTLMSSDEDNFMLPENVGAPVINLDRSPLLQLPIQSGG